MKRAALLLACVCGFLFLPVTTTASADSGNPGVFYVFFALRAGLNDGIQVCSDHDFASRKEALTFADTLEPFLGIRGLRPIYDPSNYADCVDLISSHPLTTAGPGPHERSFRFDSTQIAYAAESHFNLPLTEVEVCLPELPARVDPSQDLQTLQGDCDRPFQRTYDWLSASGLYAIHVTFRATSGSLLRGLTGVIAFWSLATGLLLLLVHRFAKSGWRFFQNHAVIAWTLDAILMLAVVFCWLFIAPYWTNWIPSLQMYLHIGVLGEGTLLALPSLGVGLAFIAGPRAALHRLEGSERKSRVVNAGVIQRLEWHRDSRTFAPTAFFALGAAGFLVLLNVRHIGLGAAFWVLGLAIIFLWGDQIWRHVRLWASRSRPADNVLTFVRAELRALGVDVSHAFLTKNPCLRDYSGTSPAGFGVAAIDGHDVMVWERVNGLPHGILAGAAIDSLGANVSWFPAVYLLMGLAFAESNGDNSVAIWSIIGVVTLMFAGRVGIALARKRRVLAKAASSHRAEEYLRGILLNRWVAARLVASRRGVPLGARPSRFQPSLQVWNRGVRVSRKFARAAHVSDESLEAATRDVMGLDLG